MNVNDTVRVLAPFDVTYPDTYVITEVITHEDGQVVYILGEIGGFAPNFVEPV